MNELALVSRFALSTIFILAGTGKLARRREFAEAVRNYQLLSTRASELVSRGMPPGELFVGALLLLGVETAPVAVVAAFCLLAFTIAIAVNLLRGRRIDCGCFGLVGDARLSWLRNRAYASSFRAGYRCSTTRTAMRRARFRTRSHLRRTPSARIVWCSTAGFRLLSTT